MIKPGPQMRGFLRLHLLRGAAFMLLVYETLLVRFWLLFLWVCGFSCLWLLQVPQIFGRTVEIAVAVAFFAGSLVLARRGWRGWHLPDGRALTRRVESDNQLRHRPLSTLDDRLANDDNDRAGALWSIWRGSLHPLLGRLRWPRPHPVLPQRDPYALRGLVLLGMVAALVMAGPGWSLRLQRGMMPVLPGFIERPADSLIIWIDPPEYTGIGQIVMKGKGAITEPVPIPDGSTLKAHLTGWVGTPILSLGEQDFPLTRLGEGAYGIEMPIIDTEHITIRQGFLTRADWPIRIVPDMPPTIEAAGDVESRAGGKIKIPLRVEDDYSVESIEITITLEPDAGTPPPLGAAYSLNRAVMSAPATAQDIAPELDLGWHPWAGMSVRLHAAAIDHRQQRSTIDLPPHVLPERNFTHPVAQKLIAMRKRLIHTPETAAKNVAHEIESIVIRPSLYHEDLRVFLSLRTAAVRLFLAQDHETAARVVELLWDTALRIEDGNLSLAHRDFLQAQKNLHDALKDPNATPEDIARRMDEMREAMANYLHEMFREMQKRMAERGIDQPMVTPEMVMRQINPQDLAAFLDQMQAEALSGNRDAARDMLAQMERFMEMMDPSNIDMSIPQDVQAMMDALTDLQALIERQEKLLDETRRQAEAAGQAQGYAPPLAPDTTLLREWGLDSMPPAPQQRQAHPVREIDSRAEHAEQSALRQMLADAMLEMDEKTGRIPENLGRADQSMKGAADALAQNNPATAVPHQEDALRHLQDGQQDMAQKLAQRLQQMMMFSFGGSGQRLDPLGRPMRDDDGGNMPWSRSNIKIPDAAERRKIQDILEDLRRKSGELTRPDYELDYFRRLMRQF